MTDPPPAPPASDAVRIVGLVVLGVVLVASIAGLTIVACFTDRDLTRPEVLTFVIALVTAFLAGLAAMPRIYRSHRWRIERNGSD